MKKTMTILFSIFAVVGIAMIVGSFVLLHAMNQFEENAYEVPGVITDIKEHYDSDDKVSHDVYVSSGMMVRSMRIEESAVTARICMLVKKSHYCTTLLIQPDWM